MTNQPEISVDEIVEEFAFRYSIRDANDIPRLDGRADEAEDWLTQTFQAECQRCDEMVEDILKMADALEIECSKDGDKGTKQWMEFKHFRNTVRDKYLTQPNNPK